MKSIKIITFERDTLVEELNVKALNIAIDIHDKVNHGSEVNELLTYGWERYDKREMNYSISDLKKKQLAYYKGKASMLLEFIVEFDVYINKNANNFLKHLNSL